MRPGHTVYAAFLALMGAALLAAPLRAQFPPDSFTNLRVLPRDIPARDLVTMMAGFTRALGVRCTHCHIGEESMPLEEYDFASDEKEAKRKARAMLEMVGRINDEHLAGLEARAEPPVRVECVTCHRGTREPRMLQDILLAAYAAGGADSVVAAYHGLRGRYYGRFTFDFSEVPLADVAGQVGRQPEQMQDAERLHALNVEMNPSSTFAKTAHAAAALFNAFGRGPADGRARLEELTAAYGADVFPERFLNQLGLDLLRRRQPAPAVDVLRLVTERHPASAGAWTALGDAHMAAGESAAAVRAFERALELAPGDATLQEKLRRARGG